jgi:hypothetical protein
VFTLVSALLALIVGGRNRVGCGTSVLYRRSSPLCSLAPIGAQPRAGRRGSRGERSSLACDGAAALDARRAGRSPP